MDTFKYNAKGARDRRWIPVPRNGPPVTDGPGLVVTSALRETFDNLEIFTEGCRLLVNDKEAATPVLRDRVYHLIIPGVSRIELIPLGYTIIFGTQISNPTNPLKPGYLSINADRCRVKDVSAVRVTDMDGNIGSAPLYGAALADRGNGGMWATYNGIPGMNLVNIPLAPLSQWGPMRWLVFGVHLELSDATPSMFFLSWQVLTAPGNTAISIPDFEGQCFSDGWLRVIVALEYDDRRHNIGAGGPQIFSPGVGNYTGSPNVRMLAYATAQNDLNFTTHPQGPGVTRILAR